MRIRIPGANFSAKNIGQVEVNIVWDTDADAYRSAIPVHAAGFNYNKNKALNKFFKDLKTQGLWPKITHLYLPILGQTEGGVDLKNPASNIGFPASGSVVTYNSAGALFLLGWSSGITHSTTNFHGGFYNTTANPDNAAIRVGMATNGGSMWIASRRAGANTSGINLSSAYSTSVPNHVGSIGPMIGSFVAATKFVSTTVDTEYAESIRTEAAPGIATPTILLGGSAAGANTFALASSIGLITVGSGLTQAEALAYAALQTTLMTALMA